MLEKFRQIGLMLRGIWACYDLVRHPQRLERVHDITNALASRYPSALEKMRLLFSRDRQGADALRDKPRLFVDLDALAQLPLGTLGKTFADHMRANNLDANALPEAATRVKRAKLAHGDELRFIRRHIYDTHDVWHVVTGFATDVAGELGLQAFCSAQTPYALPSLLLALGFLNTAIFSADDASRRLDAVARGWEMGKRAKPLFGLRWDQWWGRSLDEVRRSLDVEPYVGKLLQAG